MCVISTFYILDIQFIGLCIYLQIFMLIYLFTKLWLESRKRNTAKPYRPFSNQEAQAVQESAGSTNWEIEQTGTREWRPNNTANQDS